MTTAVEALGAGEILLNCIDNDGQNAGFDIHLVKMVKSAVKIPVVASSGAGAANHFSEVFEETNAEAGLAASIFHRRLVGIDEVKAHLEGRAIPTRITASSQPRSSKLGSHSLLLVAAGAIAVGAAAVLAMRSTRPQ